MLFTALCAGANAHPLLGAPRCPFFPASNPWNQRVDRLPDDPRSDATDEPLHPDFGTRYGIPFTTVSGHQKRVPVRFES